MFAKNVTGGNEIEMFCIFISFYPFLFSAYLVWYGISEKKGTTGKSEWTEYQIGLHIQIEKYVRRFLRCVYVFLSLN